MDDSGMVVIVLAIGGALVYGAIQALRGGAREVQGVIDKRKAHAEAARQVMEERALALLEEFPRLDDNAIALLMHDELVNQRVTDPAFGNWATPATVGRIRRTVAVAIARAERDQENKEQQ